MRKAIQVEVRLWIEADDEPAHDFAASTLEAVRDMVSKGAAAHPELSVTVKRVREITG